MKYIGIFPGTFDPVHLGHIDYALAAIEACNLTEVWFLPEKTPRRKVNVSRLEKRYNTLVQATKHHPNLKVVTLDIEQFNVTNSLPLLQAKAEGAELALLMGSDIAKYLPQWQGIEELAKTVSFIIALRGSDSKQNIEAILNKIEKANFSVLESPHPFVSSSQLR